MYPMCPIDGFEKIGKMLVIVIFGILLWIIDTTHAHSATADSLILQYYLDGSRTEPPDILSDSLTMDFNSYVSKRDSAVTDKGTRDQHLFKERIHELLGLYFSIEGYFTAEVDSISRSGDDNELNIYATSGCHFSIGSIDYHITDNDPGLLDNFTSFYREGDAYHKLSLERELRRYIRHFESFGYPLVTLEIVGFEPDSESCKVSMDIDITTGEAYYAAGVWTTGLEQHDPEYIEMASGIRKTDLITPELFDRARRNLINTDFFHDVSEGDIIIRDGESHVYFDVEERRANNFDLMFGYAPRHEDSYNFVGSGNMLIRNVGWSGNALNLSFERLENLVTRLETGYSRQWIMAYPAGAGLQFHFFQQDTSYQVRELMFDGTFYWTPERRVSVRLRQEHTSAHSSLLNPVVALDGVTRSAGFGFDFDNTDSRLNPSRGMIFHLYVESGIRRITDARVDEFQSVGIMFQQRVKTSLERLYSPLRRNVVLFALHGALVESPEYTETDLLRLGGSQSIRGYQEEQFRIARTAWSEMEYRYLLDAYSHAFLFAAGGIYERPKMLGSIEDKTVAWLRSWGFGFRYRTPIGIMQFTYAISMEDPLYNGKVHFNLSARF